jgi:hypothetical protein
MPPGRLASTPHLAPLSSGLPTTSDTPRLASTPHLAPLSSSPPTTSDTRRLAAWPPLHTSLHSHPACQSLLTHAAWPPGLHSTPRSTLIQPAKHFCHRPVWPPGLHSTPRSTVVHPANHFRLTPPGRLASTPHPAPLSSSQPTTSDTRRLAARPPLHTSPHSHPALEPLLPHAARPPGLHSTPRSTLIQPANHF